MRFVQIKSLSFPNYCIYLTEYAKKIISPLTLNEKRSKIIPHGIDDFKISSKSKLNYDSGYKIIYVSNIDEYKNQDNVLDAVDKLRKIGHNVKIIFVGGGEGKALDFFVYKQKKLIQKKSFQNCFLSLKEKNYQIYLVKVIYFYLLQVVKICP